MSVVKEKGLSNWIIVSGWSFSQPDEMWLPSSPSRRNSWHFIFPGYLPTSFPCQEGSPEIQICKLSNHTPRFVVPSRLVHLMAWRQSLAFYLQRNLEALFFLECSVSTRHTKDSSQAKSNLTWIFSSVVNPVFPLIHFQGERELFVWKHHEKCVWRKYIGINNVWIRVFFTSSVDIRFSSILCPFCHLFRLIDNNNQRSMSPEKSHNSPWWHIPFIPN